MLSVHTYIRHKIHISYWLRHIHGFLWEERSFLDIWFCMQAVSRWSPMTAFLCLHSLPETGSYSLEDILHTQKAWAGRSTDHEHPLWKKNTKDALIYWNIPSTRLFPGRKAILPQILSGASSSSSIGWLRKISRDFRHNPRISFSVNWTFLPGLEPFTKTKTWTHKTLTLKNTSTDTLNTTCWSQETEEQSGMLLLQHVCCLHRL